jgi:hypothetical protein
MRSFIMLVWFFLHSASYAGVIIYTDKTAFDNALTAQGFSGNVDNFSDLTPNGNVPLSTLDRPDFVVRSTIRGTSNPSTFEVLGSQVGFAGISSNFGADDLLFDFKAPKLAASVTVEGFGTLGGTQSLSFSLDGGPIMLGLIEGPTYVPNAFLGLISDSTMFSSLLIRNSPADQITVFEVGSFAASNAVPEPSSLVLFLGLGAAMLGFRRRSHRQKRESTEERIGRR